VKTAVEVLSRSPLLTVYRCRRGRVHLRVGVVTLHLTPAEFWELVQGIGDASVRLSVRDVVDEFVTRDRPQCSDTQGN
jgi:hypothetical protein